MPETVDLRSLVAATRTAEKHSAQWNAELYGDLVNIWIALPACLDDANNAYERAREAAHHAGVYLQLTEQGA